MKDKISRAFYATEAVVGKVIPDWLVNGTLSFIFSKISIVVHTAWFIYWFAAHLEVTLLTNIVSLEAIYVGILIGIQQLKHHKVMKKHIQEKEQNAVPAGEAPNASRAQDDTAPQA